MTRRVLWTEIRRGPAPLAALLTAAAGLLVVQAEPFGARWMSFASAVQYSLFLVGPLVMAVAVWHGGRERRRRMRELMNSASRPPLTILLVNWAALTIGTFGGLLIVVGFGALQVAPRASYWGGGWWWVLAAAFVSVAVVAALGMGIGRLLPYRVLAPLVAIATYAASVLVLDTTQWAPGQTSATTMTDRLAALVPLRRTTDLDWHLVTTHVGVSTLVWLIAVAAAALVVGVARQMVIRVGVCGLAVAAAWYVAFHGNQIVEDAAAQEPVCDASELTVCVTSVNAYGLAEARTAAEQALGPFSGLDDVSWRAAEFSLDDHDVSTIGLSEFDGGWTAQVIVWPSCGATWSAEADEAATVAAVWASSVASGAAPTPFDDTIDPLVNTLMSGSEADQHAWMSRYFAAAEVCDVDRLTILAEELA